MTFSFPIENPVVILALCLCIMLLVPPVCRKMGMPSIFGLILAGIVIGPKGLHLVSDKSGLELLSTAGLLYLMFLMTLEIDIYSFRKNKFKSVWFGALTFLIPFVAGYLTTHYLLGYNSAVSLLLACMFSSHTLISYPITVRLNISKIEPVVISIGGTIITDVAVLLFITVIVTAYSGSLSIFFWFKTIALLVGFMFLMLWVFPKISRWYFSHFQTDDAAQYTYVLFSLFASGLLAELAGIEPIVGAFLCGLALNRVIPHHSLLMNRTVFIGNSLFIPFFMIYIGMLVDVKTFFQGTDTIILAVVLTAVAISSKYLAAIITQLIYRYTNAERKLLFGLSSSHAAATIAIVVIGYDMGILDAHILNATVFIIIVTCLFSTYFTDRSGRKVALQQREHKGMHENEPDKILALVSNPDNVRQLFDFALLIHQPHEETVIHPVTISTTTAQVGQSPLKDKTHIEYIKSKARAASVPFYPAIRIDSNISEGIIRATVELQATHIVMGWSGQSGTAQYFFGAIMDNLLKNCRQTVVVTRIILPQLHFRKIFVLVPQHAAHEIGFHTWLTILQRIWRSNSANILFIGDAHSLSSIAHTNETASLSAKNYRMLDDFPDMDKLSAELTGNDLLVVISARHNSVSYSRKIALMPRVITRYFSHTNSVILYPEQPDVLPDNLGVTFGGI
jgi:Kef-type K+ transport system membrane component KefB/nucleotide-binding universal stress UspA family protein